MKHIFLHFDLGYDCLWKLSGTIIVVGRKRQQKQKAVQTLYFKIQLEYSSLRLKYNSTPIHTVPSITRIIMQNLILTKLLVVRTESDVLLLAINAQTCINVISYDCTSDNYVFSLSHRCSIKPAMQHKTRYYYLAFK